MAPLTLMLKTTRLSDLALRKLRADKVIRGSGKDNNKNLSKKLRNVKSGIQIHIKTTGKPTFLTPGAKKVFNQLRQAFIEALIFQHFDLECHIRIETNTSGYVIDRILSQLTYD